MEQWMKDVTTREILDRAKDRPKPPGIPVTCNKCGYEHKQIFASYKVITCPACGQNPIGV